MQFAQEGMSFLSKHALATRLLFNPEGFLADIEGYACGPEVVRKVEEADYDPTEAKDDAEGALPGAHTLILP